MLAGRLFPSFRITTEAPHVRRAQIPGLARTMPLLYAILMSNAAALAWIMRRAPVWLLAIFPAAIVVVGIARWLYWRRLDVDRLSDGDVERLLAKSMVICVAVALAFTIWAFALFPYAPDDEREVDIAFTMALTVVGVMFCMVPLRFSAAVLFCVVVVPMAAVMLPSSNGLDRVVAVDLLIVSGVVMIISTTYYRVFRRLNETMHDIAELGRRHERAASIDSLTGLGNRRAFFAALDAAVLRHEAEGIGFVVALFDLDGFKPVNDLHGHAAGDELLTIVASRLRSAVPADAVCARLGGDEFGVLLPSVPEAAAAERLADAVCALIAVPTRLGAAQVRVGASLGLVSCPAMGRTRLQLMENADVALYHAKASCRGRPVLFAVEHADRIRSERLLTHTLRWADFERELSIDFQPIVDVVSNRVTSFEALARWTSPVLGRVAPGAFIPLAERLGLITTMTEILFVMACRVARDWPAPLQLSFNLSVEDLVAPDAVRRLKRMVAAAGLPPERLIFEVTETAVIRDFDTASATLQALRELGCSIALDDFGTGFSSLSTLHALPLDKLKVDGSFVRALASDRAGRAVVQSIIDLCAKLGIHCVVEGVETQAQADVLHDMGCVAMQGWLFGTPIPETAMRRGDFPVAAYARAGRCDVEALDVSR